MQINGLKYSYQIIIIYRHLNGIIIITNLKSYNCLKKKAKKIKNKKINKIEKRKKILNII